MKSLQVSSPSRPDPRLRFPRGLYGITPEWNDIERLTQAVRQAAAGGMRALQFRHKTLSPPLLRNFAATLAQLCRELNLIFLVNDHWELARDVGAQGVHLGREDGDFGKIRAQAPDLLIGASCYNDLLRARAMLHAGADYLAFGTIYPSSIKPDADHAPLACLTQARQLVNGMPSPRPSIVAIGGIHPHHTAQVVQAGADAVACITGIFEAPDIQAAAATYTQSFDLFAKRKKHGSSPS